MRSETSTLKRAELLPRSLPPRGLCRVLAAAYVGVSPTKFDEMVEDGRMPQPRQIDGRRVWDVRQLDLSFDNLPSINTQNPWDKAA